MSKSKKSTFYFLRPSPFPQLYYVGYVGIIFSIVQFFMGSFSQGVFFLLLSLGILLLKFWSKFDATNSTITDFFTFIPYRTKKLAGISEVVLTEGKVSQTLNSRGSTSSINYTQYKIVIVTAEGNYILKEGRSKSKLLTKAKLVTNSLGVKLNDYTSE